MTSTSTVYKHSPGFQTMPTYTSSNCRFGQIYTQKKKTKQKLRVVLYMRWRWNPSSSGVHLIKICTYRKMEKTFSKQKNFLKKKILRQTFFSYCQSNDINYSDTVEITCGYSKWKRSCLELDPLGFIICWQLWCSHRSSPGHSRANPLPQSSNSLLRNNSVQFSNWSSSQVWVHL